MPEQIIQSKPPLVNPGPDDIRIGMELANLMLWATDPRNRRAIYAGRTWADFKKAVEALGVTDTTDLGSVEYGITRYGSSYIVVDQDECGSIEIRYMR